MLQLLLFAFALHAQTPTTNTKLQEFKFSGAVDLVLPQYLSEGPHEDSQLNLRGAELMFYGPVDPYFDARINIAAHQEDGEYHLGLHEAFVSSSKVIPMSRFRLGQFFLDIGRLNNFHQHDWPFTSAPFIHRAIFGDEGVTGLGAEYTLLVPTNRFFEITLGVVNGNTWGEKKLTETGTDPLREYDGQADFPTHYIHPKTFFDFGEGKGLMVGATALRRWNPADQDVTIYGVDATYKGREGKLLRWLLQGEYWSENTRRPGQASGRQTGGYIYGQYGLNELWSAGVRLDTYQGKKAELEDGSKDDIGSFAFVPTVTFKPSEMSLLRASYTHEEQIYENNPNRIDRKIELQLVYILGSHPVHDF